MTHPITVNDALDRLAELLERPIELEGILGCEPEGYYVAHYPLAERKAEYNKGGRSYRPFIVLAFGSGSLQPNHEALPRWIGKRVRVHGVLRSRLVSAELDHLDFFGLLTPASIEPYSLQRVTTQ